MLLAGMAAAGVLAGCGKESPTAPAASGGTGKGESLPVSVETIAAQAKGFSVGSTMSTRVVYVFFDPQCPHCAALWAAARPLKPQARFVWIPVALLNEKSAPQGAFILHSADPVAAMDQHEASLQARQGGITAMGVTDDQKDEIKRNTELLTKFGFASVPTVVAKHAQTGVLVTVEGSLPTAALAQKLGLVPPA